MQLIWSQSSTAKIMVLGSAWRSISFCNGITKLQIVVELDAYNECLLHLKSQRKAIKPSRENEWPRSPFMEPFDFLYLQKIVRDFVLGKINISVSKPFWTIMHNDYSQLELLILLFL